MPSHLERRPPLFDGEIAIRDAPKDLPTQSARPRAPFDLCGPDPDGSRRWRWSQAGDYSTFADRERLTASRLLAVLSARRHSMQSRWTGDVRSPTCWQRWHSNRATFSHSRERVGQGSEGPADALGLGPEFRAHMALGFVVQDLRRFPGRGWRLVAAALRSPVVNNRNGALNALGAWGPSAWPPEALPSLHGAAREEPNPQVRERIEKLVRGEDSPGPRVDVP